MRRGRRRSGQVLLEFALIAFVLYLLMAATIEFGRAMFGAQTIQAAADLAAREISRTPLSVTYTSLYGTGPCDTTAALNDCVVRQRIFDDRLLVIDLDANGITPATAPAGALDALFAKFPVVNQQLRALMIFDQVAHHDYLQDHMEGDSDAQPFRNILRYPGALVWRHEECTMPALPPGYVDSNLRVAIPVIEARDPNGIETIRWVSVIEEITPGAFNIGYTGPGPAAGTVGVRINYPFQAATLSAYQQVPAVPNPNTPVQAHDSQVTELNTLQGIGEGVTAVMADPPSGTNQGLQPYGGKYGLGFQLAQVPGSPGGPNQRLRPFRSLLSGQAVYRREVFAPQPNQCN